jgi:hypothetical protein
MRVFIRWRRTTDGYEVWSDFPNVRVTSADRAYAINFVKGAALHVIGDWPKVPEVAFSVIAILTPHPVRTE